AANTAIPVSAVPVPLFHSGRSARSIAPTRCTHTPPNPSASDAEPSHRKVRAAYGPASSVLSRVATHTSANPSTSQLTVIQLPLAFSGTAIVSSTTAIDRWIADATAVCRTLIIPKYTA